MQDLELTEILKCPKTGNKLRFDDGDKTVRVGDSDVEYPVVDGIIDFCPGVLDKVSKAYDKVADRYDAILTRPSTLRRLCNTIVWGFTDDHTYAETVLSYLPSGFDGILLDVPVGTGIFTSPIYARFPKATIIGADLSIGVLKKARERFESDGLKNVFLLRADAANLPLESNTVDLVLSMNGWHVFTDKHQAVVEIGRILRNQGKLIACGYVKGARRLSDWFVKRFGTRNGFFSPPFLKPADLVAHAKGFTIIREGSVKSLAYFQAFKEEKEKNRTAE